MSVVHASFVIEKVIAAPPAAVFRAFSDPAVKAAWFSGPPGWTQGEQAFDFREGGVEVNVGGPAEGPQHGFRARYLDIVPDRRIVSAYEMDMDGVRISASLTTIELSPQGPGTKLVFTEHGAFLDGHEDPQLREDGSRWLMDTLAAYLERELQPA